MFVGRVRKIFTERGYGFLQMPGSRDIFFHATVLEGTSFQKLKEGDLLQFEPYSQDSSRLRAKKARLISEDEAAELQASGQTE